MTISDNYAPDKTSGNGVTAAFSGNWNTLSADYFRLYWEDKTTGVQTLKTKGTHYTLAFTASGYTATHDGAFIPPSTVWVIRAREIAKDQTDPYKTSTGFQGATVENSFDKAIAISQDLQNNDDRTVKFPLGSEATITDPVYGDLPLDGYGIVWDGTAGRMRNTEASLEVLEGNAAIVAGAIASVITVATNIADVNTVAGDIADVNTVAAAIANVNAVGANIANVNTVAGIDTEVTTVAGIDTEVTTVAGIAANVTTVAGIDSEVTTVAGIDTEVVAVAAIDTEIVTVSGIDTEVTTVAGISANVTTVAGISAAVSTVSGISAAVSTVSGISAAVSTVSGISANVTTVAGISGNVTTVAGISANVTTVAGISANVTTVAGISANVTTVAGVATDVTTVATNVTDVVSAAQAINSAMKFTFASSTVMADPTTGLLRLNNATPSSVTAIAIDDLSAQTGNPDLSAFIITWDDSTNTNKGTLRITKGSAPATFAIYTITGLTDNVGWTELAVTYVTGNGTFSAADTLFLAFDRAGNVGATGAAGSVPLVDAGGTVDAITANYSPDLTLADYTVAGFISTGANTSTTPSFAPDGLTAHTITARGGQALVAGDIGAAGSFHFVEYDLANTRWELLNPAMVIAADIKAKAVTLAKMDDLAQDAFIIRTTASTGVPETATCTAAARTVLDDATVGAMLTTLGGQPLDATLTALAGLATGANVVPVFTGTDTVGAATLTASTLLGMGSTGNAGVMTLGTGLSFSGTVLSASAAAAGITQIAAGNCATGSPSVIDFTSIAQTYRGLVLHVEAATNDTATRALKVDVDFGNGLASANNEALVVQISNTTVTNVSCINSLWTAATQTAAQVSSCLFQIMGYQNGIGKQFQAAAAIVQTSGSSWNNGTNHIAIQGMFSSSASTHTAETRGLTGIRLTWDNVATGVFDGGTYKLFGIN